MPKTKHPNDGKTVTLMNQNFHTSFVITIEHMGNLSPEAVKDQLQKRYKVVRIREVKDEQTRAARVRMNKPRFSTLDF